MATKLRKTKREKLAESNSDDDSDSENSGVKKSSHTSKRKNKYNKAINALCDAESSSDKESEKFYENRTVLLSKVSAAKSSHTVINIDLSSSSNSDSSSSKKRMSKPNKKSTTKRKRKTKSSEFSSESAPEKTKCSKKITKSPKTKSTTSKSKNKNSHEISQDNGDSSSSKEFQEPKLKKKKTLQESFGKYNFNDYSNVTTPSRVNEGNIAVESAQEISFKHYVIHEIKKFQKVNSQLHDDLECYNDYLLKKKIGSIEDAKFFIHKILKLYEDTFTKFRENRQEFIKIYENWMNELTNEPKEVEKKKRFNLSSDESDNILEESVNKLTKNNKSAEKIVEQRNKNKSMKSNTDEASTSDVSIDSKLVKIQKIVAKDSPVVHEPNKSEESINNGDVLSSPEENNKSTLKGKEKSKLKLNDTSVYNNEKSILSNNSSEESENDSLIQGSGCDSDLIFSSEESKAKRRSKIDKKKTEIDEEKKATKLASAAVPVAEQTVASLSSDSEDLFDTSTGEIANTPIQRKSTPATHTSVDKEDEVVEEVQNIAEEEEQLSAPAPTAELNKSNAVTDPKEREALMRLLDNDDDDSDGNADSEPEEEEEEEAAADEVAEVSATASNSSPKKSKEEAAKTAVVRKKKKFFTKHTKKRSSVCSDSSSSDDAEAARTTRQSRNKTSDGSAAFRMAPPPRRKMNTFDVHSNKHYLADEKLRRKCLIKLERLPESELAKHARALDKSRKHVEKLKVQSLANLDNLEKKKKSKKNSKADESSESNAANVKEPSPKKKKSKQDEKSTVVDFLGKKIQTDSNESSDEKEDDCENQRAFASVDESFNQSPNNDAEAKAKEALLRGTSSSSDELVENEMDVDDDSKKQKMANRTKDKKEKKASPADHDNSKEDKTDEKKDKSSWRKDKLLTFKLDGSEGEEEIFSKSQEKKKVKQAEAENDKNLEEERTDEKEDKGDGSESDEEIFSKSQENKKGKQTDNSKSQESLSPCKKTKSTKKIRKTRRIVDSDSDVKSVSEDENENENSSEEESDEAEDKKDGKKEKRQRRAQSSDSESSSSGNKQKAKRRRIKKVASDSESDDKDSPGKGRKNIRKVLKDKYVTDDTRKAAQDEEERLKRIAERQKLFNEMHEIRLAGEEKVQKLVLDIDEETKEELVVVDEELAKRLKPHQARGIKFMWDACFESIDQIGKSEGSGCIIAHCMGLGKTFQVVTLAHTLLSNENTGVKTIMVVCPLSTVLNWTNEFNIWLKHVNNRDDIEIHEMTKLKKNIERKHKLESWQKYGGVLIIGYEMFRNLTSTGKKMRKNMQESIMKSLVDPGADLVVCDEGHLLKNEDSALSKAMKLVRTMRRIVLTGTPLQNNLKEYHCMVQFVKPNLLGTKKEFLNRFVNPITNGQFDDSTPYDVKLMKKRAHVLHKMLEGSVQRFDYSVLTPFLPPKQEYVIFVRLTDVQKKLYQYYLDNFARRMGGRNVTLFADFQSLQRIWTHPYVLRLNAEKVEKANEKKRLEASDSEGSLKDFIDDDSTSASEASSKSSSASDSDIECLDSDGEKAVAVKKRGTRANPIAEPEPAEQVEETAEDTAWWSEFISEEQFNDLRISTKLMLLFAILKESESIGDKVLVFSQSLYSLTNIEHFLNLMDEQSQKDGDPELLNGHTGSWALGVDYFRLDGSTSAENRSIWSKIFNNPKNTRARLFLISTRAGGLGINLIGANRVIIFDASWNPSHDVQSIFRIYRFGQKKPCYVYRFLAGGTMEEKIYNRQVTKLSLACRVVDEQQIERHYSNTDLAELYQFDTCEDQSETLTLPKDRMLAEIFSKYKDLIVKCHEHDSLLENKAEEELDEEERKQAWAEYEDEKKGIRQQGFNNANNYAFNQMLMNMNVMPEFQGVKALLQKDYPDVPPEHLDVLTRQAMFDMYRQIDQQAALNSLNNFRNPLMPGQNTMTNPTIQGEIFRQQNIMMSQAQPNYYGVNQMPVYSGRGRPPKFTSVNNQIVTNPMYLGNAQATQSLQSVPNDNEVQVLNELPVTSSSKQTASDANN